MPRSDEAEVFFNAVYRAVQEIPHGKVTSYGHIAKLVGTRAFVVWRHGQITADNEQLNGLARWAFA